MLLDQCASVQCRPPSPNDGSWRWTYASYSYGDNGVKSYIDYKLDHYNLSHFCGCRGIISIYDIVGAKGRKKELEKESLCVGGGSDSDPCCTKPGNQYYVLRFLYEF